jgi:hypothetical protein
MNKGNPFKQFKAVSTSKFTSRYKPPFWVHLITLLLGIGLIFAIAHSGSVNAEAYKKSEIKGIVQKVEGFTRNAPILLVNDKRVIVDGVPLIEFGKYIAPNDSLVKLGGSETITTYRSLGDTTEVVEWKEVYDKKWQQLRSSVIKSYVPNRQIPSK